MQNKKNIVFVQNIVFPQQGAIDIFYYSKFLAKHSNYKVRTIVSHIDEDISHSSLSITSLGESNGIAFALKAFFQIKELVKKEKIDYVYFFAQNPLSVFLQFLVSKILKLKTIYDVVSGPIGTGIIPLIAKKTIQLGVLLSDKYVVLDKGLIKKLNLSLKKKHCIVGMGYDKESFHPQVGVDLFDREKEELIFTYIGSLSTQRRLEIFIEAFINNLIEGRKIKLFFIGDGDGKEILKQTSGKHLNKSIFFLGKKPHAQIPGFINSSDILISYVPKVEYFEYQPPSKVLEYLACDKPVIATNTFAQKQILKNHPFLIHEDDLLSTTKKISYLINNFDEIIKKNYSATVSSDSWEQLVLRIKKLIESS